MEAGYAGRSTYNNFPSPGPQTPVLRCQLCHGRRSSFYHSNHSSDPMNFPPEEICSRRRTRCAVNKAKLQASRGMLAVIHELPADEVVN